MKQLLFVILSLICFWVKAQPKPDSLTNKKDTTKLFYIDSLGERVYNRIEVESEFTGGMPSWRKFLEKNLQPDNVANALGKNDLKKGRFKQTAMVAFTVCTDGSICDLEVINNVHPAVKKEALRVMQLTPKWTPGYQNGKAVKSKKRQPITFVVIED